MVKEITGLGEFEAETKGPGLVVVDFFTTWCGPCKKIAPFIEQLAQKYPEVKFIKVDIERNEDIAAPRRISSIPTFHFIVKGQLVDEMKGADPGSLEQKVVTHKVSVDPFGGSAGHKLAAGPSDPNAPPALSAREARLKAFAAMEGPRKQDADSTADNGSGGASGGAGGGGKGANDDDEEAAALAKAMELSMAAGGAGSNNAATNANASSTGSSGGATDAAAAEYAAAEAELDALDAANAMPPQHFQEAPGQEWEEEMVPVPVNEDFLSQLLEMGFPDARARKGLVHGGSLEGALAWIAEHQDDADIDQPYMVKKSDTIPKPPLTEEEKRERQAAIQARIKSRREERARQEKAEAIKREKERRERGQKMEETLEERQRLQRKREAERIRREKEDEKKERARLKAEIARDKEIRRRNKGVLPSVLGVDGYNPSIIQYDKPGEAEPSDPANADATAAAADVLPAKRATGDESKKPSSSSTSTSAAVAAPKRKPVPVSAEAAAAAAAMNPSQKVDSSIQTLMRYRTGGDGGQALKLLLTFVRNVVEHPEEPKYRSINTEGNAFKTKLLPLVGSVALLKAVGFQKNEDDGKMKFEGELPNALLTETLQKLVTAEALYRQQNP